MPYWLRSLTVMWWNILNLPPAYRAMLRLSFQFGQDEAYNQWSAQLAQRQREKGQDVIYVKIEALKTGKIEAGETQGRRGIESGE